MADKLATLGIIVDPSGAIVGTAAVDAALVKTAATSKATTGAMKAQWASVRTLFVGAAAAIAGIGAGFTAISALSEFAKFEQGMRNVAAVSGSTAQELRALEEAALDMAIATRYNPKQTTDALYALASQGLSAAESIEVLPNLLALAEAGQGELGKTTELVVSTMAQFNLEADQSKRVVDVLTAAIGASATNIHRLQIGMAAAGPASFALNQTFENTVATVAMLTTVLGNGEMAGTGLKTILGQLAAEAEDMGLKVFDSGDKMQDLILTIEQMGESGVTIQEIWKTLGLRGGPAMSALISQGIESMEDMREKVQANGQAAKIASEQLDTLSGDIDQLGSSADVFQVRFGRMLGEQAREAIQYATELIRDMTGGLGAAKDELDKFTNRWGLLLGQLVEDGGLIKLTFEGLGYIFAGLKWAVVNMYEVIRDMPINMMAVVQLLGETFKHVWGDMGRVAGTLADTVNLKWLDIKLGFNIMIEEIKIAWDDLTTSLYDSLNEWLTGAGGMFAGMGGKFAVLGQGMLAAANSMGEASSNTEEYKENIVELLAEYGKEAGIIDKNATARDNAHKASKAAYVKEIDSILKVRKEMLKNTDTSINGIKEVMVTAKRVPGVIKEIPKAFKEANTHTLAAGKSIVKNIMDFIDGVMEAVEFAEKELKRAIDQMRWGDITPLLAIAIRNGFANGAKEGFAILKEGFATDKVGAIAGGIAFTADSISAFKEASNPVQGLFDVAGSIPIPQVQAVVAAVGALDGLFGGKILGTDWEVMKSGLDISLGASGFTGSQFTTEKKEKPLFLGSKTRTVESDLELELVGELEKAFDEILNTIAKLSAAFGVDLGSVITGTFSQTFNKKGELTSSISTVLGRQWTESIEDYTRRLLAENVLAVVGLSAGDSSSTRTMTDAEIIAASDFDRGNFGKKNKGQRKADEEMARIIDAARSGGTDQITEVLGEVNNIAERWRHDAVLLLEGAQFLAIAQGDIVKGYNILHDGSLTDIVDLTEELSHAGEAMADTYNRMKEDSINLEKALKLMNIGLDLSRTEFVKFAVDIEEAAGGLERANQLWTSFFDNYFTEQEKTVTELADIINEVNNLNTSIGRTDINFGNFRSMFEEAMPTLSPQEIADWLALGDALARASELAGGPEGLAASIETYVIGAIAAADSTLNLADVLNLTQGYLNEAIIAYDGSAESQAALTVAINNRYQSELAYLNMLEISSARIDAIIDNAVVGLQLDGMTTEEQYNFLKFKADELVSSLDTLTDPEDIANVVEEIERLRGQAYGLLDDNQKNDVREDFITFLQDLAILAQDRIEELKGSVESDQLDNNAKLELILIKFGESQTAAVSELSSAADTINSAADTFAAGVNTFVNTPITINVNNRNASGYGDYQRVGGEIQP